MNTVTRTVVLTLGLIAAVGAPPNARQSAPAPLRVVAEVDYTRYAGRWYEIARLPNRFEDKCIGNITATYAPRNDGRIDVTNRCLETGNKVNVAKGVARRVQGQPTSVLQVRFAPAWLSFLSAVWGDYRIISLAPDYSHTVVGSEDRKYLWVLARTPALDESTYRTLLSNAKAQGFDVSRIIKPRHGIPE
jgi:apolipoprotein D and lipocalin family protein